jgi:replication factor A1
LLLSEKNIIVVKKMELTEIIERILQSRQDLTGVEIQRKPFQPEILFRDLVSGLKDVTIAGRVIIVYPTKTFTRPQKTEGKVAHLLVADESGKLNIVLWDDKTSFVENGIIKQGQIIRILHGYVREGFNGKLEVHVGSRGNIQISPPTVGDREYPSIAHFVQRVKDLTKPSEETIVEGIVDRMHSVSTFERSDGTLGKVRRLVLRDETGQIPLVLWNNKVDELLTSGLWMLG